MKLFEGTLHTERLLLRPCDDSDAEELYEMAKEPEVGYWCGWKSHKDIEESLFVLRNVLNAKETYAICLENSKKMVGMISIKLKEMSKFTDKDDECEIGYWIGKPYWKNGYAYEAAKEIIRHAFEDLNMSTIWCGYYEGNEKSMNLQRKLGFVFHHVCYGVEVEQLNETRVEFANYLTKEMWLEK